LLVQLDPDRLKPMELAATGLFGHGLRLRGALEASGLERVSKG